MGQGRSKERKVAREWGEERRDRDRQRHRRDGTGDFRRVGEMGKGTAAVKRGERPKERDLGTQRH